MQQVLATTLDLSDSVFCISVFCISVFCIFVFCISVFYISVFYELYFSDSTVHWHADLVRQALATPADGNSDLGGLGFNTNSIWFHQRLLLRTKYRKVIFLQYIELIESSKKYVE